MQSMSLLLTSHVPTTLDPRTAAEADALLDEFGEIYPLYQHGAANQHIAWLERVESIEQDAAIEFLCAWWGFSYMTPRVLLRIASNFEDQAERRFVMMNYIEEDGFAHEGDDTHHVLLQKLIQAMGGEVRHIDWAEEMVRADFFDRTAVVSPAYAAGVLSAFEHPALDITRLIELVVEKSGHAELLGVDPYLTIHTTVEPSHIVWAHGASKRWIERGHRAEVEAGFRMVMEFWVKFWGRVVAGLQMPMA